LFWADGAGTETPPGHWNSIAQIIADARGNTLNKTPAVRVVEHRMAMPPSAPGMPNTHSTSGAGDRD